MIPSSLPSSCRPRTMTASPLAMACIASSLCSPVLSRARSPPRPRPPRRAPRRGRRRGRPMTPKSTTRVFSPRFSTKSFTYSKSLPFVSRAPTSTTVFGISGFSFAGNHDSAVGRCPRESSKLASARDLQARKGLSGQGISVLTPLASPIQYLSLPLSASEGCRPHHGALRPLSAGLHEVKWNC